MHERKTPSTWVRPRLNIGNDIALGPTKIDLLQRIGETHSISAAARAMDMPYKKAWLILDQLNQGFGRPVVVTATGGKGGGGAELTTLGHELIIRYSLLEQRLNETMTDELQALQDLLQS